MFKSVCAILVALVCITPQVLAETTPASDHPTFKHPYNLPPSADLVYTIKAKHGALALNGNASIRWVASAHNYDLAVETKAGFVGKILDSHSEGIVNEFGLAPVLLREKRFRKPQHTVSFDRSNKLISFSESAVTYPIKGGEQDRTSITWQLVALARGAPDKFKAGSVWPFFVLGRRDAEVWTFKVVGRETIRTAQGEVSAIHITKLSSKSREEQQLDLWLAPSMEWYPVRVLFSETNGTEVDQVLLKIIKK